MGRYGWGYSYGYGGGRRSGYGGGGRCYRCGRTSHYANECFARTHVDGTDLTKKRAKVTSSTSSSSKSKPKPAVMGYSSQGHTVTMAKVQKTGGKHEGKVRALVKGPATGPGGKAFYGEDAADVKGQADSFIASSKSAATRMPVTPATAAPFTPSSTATCMPVTPSAAAIATQNSVAFATVAGAAKTPAIVKTSGSAVTPSPTQTMSSNATMNDEDAFAGDDDVQTFTLLCTVHLRLVGIQYYTGVVHPGEFVLLQREPQNPYDRNAICVRNLEGVKVGHVKGTQAQVLSPIMDNVAWYGVSKFDGMIPNEGDRWTLPLTVEIYGDEQKCENAIRLREHLSKRAPGICSVQYPVAQAPVATQAESGGLPKQEALVVHSRTVVKEWKSQEELDSMFARQKEKLSELPPFAVPPQIKSTLLDHQLVGASWLVHREKEGEDDIPFYQKIQEKGKTVWFSEITNSSQAQEPPSVRGGILADDMGLGKTLQTLCLILANSADGHVYPEGGKARTTDQDAATAKKEQTTRGPSEEPASQIVKAHGDGNEEKRSDVASAEGAAAKAAVVAAALATISITQVRKVPVKNLRWILSNCVVLDGKTDPHGLFDEALQKMKKPELVDICHKRLSGGSLIVGRFKAGVAAKNPTRGDVSATVTDASPSTTKLAVKPPTDAPTKASLLQKVQPMEIGPILGPKKCITTLIVCPVSVISGWLDQINKHVKEQVLRVELYQGPNRASILPRVKTNGVDILLTSYGTLASEFNEDPENPGMHLPTKKRKGVDSDATLDSIFAIDFHRVILDEAHEIRNSRTRGFKAVKSLLAERRLCLSGTPLQNKPEDVHALFSFLKFTPLDQKDVFRRAIAQPIRDGDVAGLARLRAAMGHLTLRRNKVSANISLTERELHVRSVELPPGSTHRSVYDLLFDSARTAFQATLSNGDKEVLKNYSSVFEVLLRIRQACCSGALIPKERLQRAESVMEELKGRAEDSKPLTAEEGRLLFQKLKGTLEAEMECSGCLCEIDNATILRTCSHAFCEECIGKVSSQMLCLVCRKPFQNQDMTKMSSLLSAKPPAVDTNATSPSPASETDLSELERSPKVQALLLAINEMESTEKGVIFSQFTKYLDIIGKVLISHGHTFTRIDGSMRPADRVKAIESFNSDSDKPRFILCSLKAAGTGINLTRANHTFMMDLWWNKGVEDQAMDRVHRIGQKRKVRIVKFVVADSIEERLIKIQDSKAALGKGTMEVLKPDEVRRARIEDLKGLFQITSD